ncbi:MAG: OmpA family protein [Flavobacteriales bacterium]|nr:OmpA family protein [Flavobacteriales bacterium]HRP59836.1 OmpA family protein [Vicingus sp.]
MKNRLIKGLSVALISLVAISCSTEYHIRKGNGYHDNLAYSSAIPHYQKVHNKTYVPEVEEKLADSYYKMNKLKEAEKLYKVAVKRETYSPQINFNYAKILMSNGEHKEAVPYFKKYLSSYPDDAVAQMLLASCISVGERYRDTTLYKLYPINYDEFKNSFSIIEYQEGAVFVADKEVFSGSKKSQWTGNSYLDLYEIKKDEDGFWMNPQLLKGDVNGRFHEGPACFSNDGNTVYFTRSNYFKRKMKVNENKENNLKIFKATLKDGKWKNLEEFPFNSDDYSIGHPTLSADEKTLYFVSDMPGGFGGTDIYKSVWDGSNWSKPENLGAIVNTKGNEMFPYIHTDDALYFSSNAHNSMGGLDVFITYFNGEVWAKPENLNYPLNSSKDDFGFNLSKKNANVGFVSSSRTDADKMYAFDKKPPKFNLYGKARLKGTQTRVKGVTVQVTNAKTGKVISMVSDAKGNFELKLEPEADYDLYCTKEGCFTRTDKISTVGLKYSQDFYADFEVEPIVLDKPIVLENIYYDFDKWNIRPDAVLELDKLVKILVDNPNIEIELSSHTDSRGNDRYNDILSEKRAMAAVQYIIANGIDQKRLTYKGYGEKKLVNHCANDVVCTREEHQQNRRTEFKVTKINK